MQDSSGQTGGKGLRVIMAHAIEKHDPMVTSNNKTGFPVEKGCFTDVNVLEGRDGVGLKLSEAKTAASVWKAKSAKGD